MIFLAVYVDDVLITGTHLEEIQSLKHYLHHTFKIKDLGQLHYFLGLEVLYKHDGVPITQREFAQDLIQEFDCGHCSALSFPLYPSIKLRADGGVLLADPTLYRKLVSKLNFLTSTRMDVAYVVQHFS